jgi:short-subunit dehydrogenase
MADPGTSAKDIREIATSLRQIHGEVVAIGTEDHQRLERLEAEVRRMHRKIDALCRSVGYVAREAAERDPADG